MGKRSILEHIACVNKNIYHMMHYQESDEEHPGHYKVSPETHEKLAQAGKKGAAARNAKAKEQVRLFYVVNSVVTFIFPCRRNMATTLFMMPSQKQAKRVLPIDGDKR